MQDFKLKVGDKEIEINPKDFFNNKDEKEISTNSNDDLKNKLYSHFAEQIEQNERIIKIFNKKNKDVKDFKLKAIKPSIRNVDYENKIITFDLAFYGDFVKTSNLNTKNKRKKRIFKKKLFCKKYYNSNKI